ncbi:MAG: 3-phosphoshikimate 1-carboxyvinyltransferase [Candidatus Aureabacteria bacterium]|nr:3-phosphoshikimate 1-carboxyvinyltransferase [Candidatus Auribacterota bacterium]
MPGLIINPVSQISGEVNVPGDKSISHRAIVLTSLAYGRSEIRGFLKSEDCLATLEAFRLLGVSIEEKGDKIVVEGVGNSGLKSPAKPLDFGNSGTGLRLSAGAIAGYNVKAVLTGDKSLSSRPMDRIIGPLKLMGCKIRSVSKDKSRNITLPFEIEGGSLEGIFYDMPVASAQVKSCILIAGLNARGTTIVHSNYSSRDHTERMMNFMGGKILESSNSVAVNSDKKLHGVELDIPGDFSGAAFLIGAALIVKGPGLVIKNVGLNPTRMGFLNVLEKMGACITIEERGYGKYQEPVGDINIKSSVLQGVEISGDIIPNIIDEIPLLAVIASFAKGRTIIKNAEELRVKESDRIANIVRNLKIAGVTVIEKEDGLIIDGSSKFKGGVFPSYKDHRIAMSLAIGALAADGPSEIKEAEFINTSFPDFEETLKKVAK